MAEALVEGLERNPGLRRRLARAIAPDVVAGTALSPELRGALVQGLVREVATGGEVGRLRESLEALRREVADLRGRVAGLEARLGTVERVLIAAVVSIWGLVILVVLREFIIELLGL